MSDELLGIIFYYATSIVEALSSGEQMAVLAKGWVYPETQ